MLFSTNKLEASPTTISIKGFFLIKFCTNKGYFFLSTWARTDQTARPFVLLRVLYCKAQASAAKPIIPPRASISLTRCVFARPPTAGLQESLPIARGSEQTSFTLQPSLAAAKAASMPACPPPTTTRLFSNTKPSKNII